MEIIQRTILWDARNWNMFWIHTEKLVVCWSHCTYLILLWFSSKKQHVTCVDESQLQKNITDCYKKLKIHLHGYVPKANLAKLSGTETEWGLSTPQQESRAPNWNTCRNNMYKMQIFNKYSPRFKILNLKTAIQKKMFTTVHSFYYCSCNVWANIT